VKKKIFFSSSKENRMKIAVQLFVIFSMNVAAYDIWNAPFHPNIHNMGNIGLGGKIHASAARFATRMIDKKAYDGVNMREVLAKQMSYTFLNDSSVLEIGCGAGTLTEHLSKYFQNLIALDTSQEMIDEAKVHLPDVDFRCENGANAHTFDVDVAIASMLVHELPKNAHLDLMNAMQQSILKKNGEVWIVDIHPVYKPSFMMKMGEPFVLSYLEEFETTVKDFCSDNDMDCDRADIIPEHVRLWVLRPNFKI
jgi:2-polyprenyl-3-methyl-5-hydroxy-6-metoxy-1,4-benzoquinol methylase